MKRNKVKIMMSCVALGLIFLMYTACTKDIKIGYLSDFVRYAENPIYVTRGMAEVRTAPLVLDGTSQPIKVKLLGVRVKQGDQWVATNDLTTPRYALGWTSTYDPWIDTTADLIAAKRANVRYTPMMIIEGSGAAVFNSGSLSLPGNEYRYDLEVSNSNGTKQYTDIGNVKLQYATSSYELVNDPYWTIKPLNSETIYAYIEHEKYGKVYENRNPIMSVKKISDQGSMIILKFRGKDGKCVNMKKGWLTYRPGTGVNNWMNPKDGLRWLNCFEGYSLSNPKPVYTDSSATYTLPVMRPFPYTNLPKANGTNWYFRLPNAAIKSIDSLPGILYKNKFKIDCRFTFKLNETGTWEIVLSSSKVVFNP